MIEDMTIDDLCKWANGLGLCTFNVKRRFDRDEVVCEGDKVGMYLHFGNFAVGGARFVSFSAQDNRDGISGMSAPIETLDEVERFITIYGERLRLLNPQMQLFLI